MLNVTSSKSLLDRYMVKNKKKTNSLYNCKESCWQKQCFAKKIAEFNGCFFLSETIQIKCYLLSTCVHMIYNRKKFTTWKLWKEFSGHEIHAPYIKYLIKRLKNSKGSIFCYKLSKIILQVVCTSLICVWMN